MKEIKITIEGTTPLMLCRFTDEAQIAATTGTRTSMAARDKLEPKEQAEEFLYKDTEGKSVIPQPNMLRCIIDGGKFHKAGKNKVTTLKSSLIPACVSIEEFSIPIVSKKGWEVDARPVRIPATGGRIIRYRPVYYDWKLSFTVSLDDEILGANLLRDIIDDSGKRIGLGAFRPDCKGPFGKFKVTSWKAKNLAKAA